MVTYIQLGRLYYVGPRVCELAKAALIPLGQCTGQNDWSIFDRGSIAALSHTPSQYSLGIKFIARICENSASWRCLHQGFGEQVSNLILVLMVKILIVPWWTCSQKLWWHTLTCFMSGQSLGSFSSCKASALSSNTLQNTWGASQITLKLWFLISATRSMVGITSLREDDITIYSALVLESATCVRHLEVQEKGQLA